MLSKTMVALAVTGTCALAACSSSGTAGHGSGVAGSVADRSAHTSTIAGSSGPAGSSARSAPSTPTGAGGADAFCTELASAGKMLVSLGGGDPTKVDPKDYERETNHLVAVAPGAVKSDVQAIGAVELEVVKGNLGAEAKLQEPAMLTHVRHFGAWMQANCPGVIDNPTALPSE